MDKVKGVAGAAEVEECPIEGVFGFRAMINCDNDITAGTAIGGPVVLYFFA